MRLLLVAKVLKVPCVLAALVMAVGAEHVQWMKDTEGLVEQDAGGWILSGERHSDGKCKLDAHTEDPLLFFA
jgi:hypothetical protein